MKPSNIGPGGSEDPFLFVGSSLVETSSQELVVLGVEGGGKDTLIVKLYLEKWCEIDADFLTPTYSLAYQRFKKGLHNNVQVFTLQCQTQMKDARSFYHALRGLAHGSWRECLSH